MSKQSPPPSSDRRGRPSLGSPLAHIYRSDALVRRRTRSWLPAPSRVGLAAIRGLLRRRSYIADPILRTTRPLHSTQTLKVGCTNTSAITREILPDIRRTPTR